MKRNFVLSLVVLAVTVVPLVIALAVTNRDDSTVHEESETLAPVIPPPTEGWRQRGQGIFGENETIRAGDSVAISWDGSVLAIGGGRSGPDRQGHIKVFDWNVSSQSWRQRGGLIVGDSNNSWIGDTDSMKLSGDGMIIAIVDELLSGGKVRILEWTIDGNGGSLWKQKGQTISGDVKNLGLSIAMSDDGNVFAEGSIDFRAKLDPTGPPMVAPGRIQVYSWNGSAQRWDQRGETFVGTTDFDGITRSALNSDGTVLAIPAVRWGGTNGDIFAGPGQVRMYEWNKTSWNQVGADITGKVPGGGFGFPIALSSTGKMVAMGGQTVLVASKPLVEVFRRESSGGDWTQMGQTLFPESISQDEPRVQSLSLATLSSKRDSMPRLAISYWKHTQVYDWNESASFWEPAGSRLANNDEVGKTSEMATSRNGKVMVIGTPGESTLKSGPNHVYEWFTNKD